MIKKQLLTFIFVIGCAVPAMAQSNDVSQLSGRINQLENHIQTLSRAVFRGDVDTPPPSPSDAGNPSSSMVADLDIRLSELENSLRHLTGKIEEQQYHLEQLRRKVESDNTAPIAAPLLQNRNRSENESAGEDAREQEDDDRSARAAPSDTPPDELYERAFVNIREGRYDQAEQGFKTFLDSYPEHKLAGNSQYWLAETYYVRGDYTQAARSFAQGYQDYPESSKAADNLLKLGLSLARIGNIEDACVTLSQLKDQFPDETGPVMRRARQERANMNCD